jgi:hypothetical protein
MKKFLFIFFCLIPLTVFANEDTYPQFCLYTDKNGDVSDLTCMQFDKTKMRNVKGVCVFKNDRWQRGTWRVGPKGARIPLEKRFTKTKMCDQGIEYISGRDDSLVVGPRFYAVKDPKNKINSVSTYNPASFIASPKDLDFCYRGQRSSGNKGSFNPVRCVEDPLKKAPGYCGVKTFNNFRKINKSVKDKRKVKGTWFVQYPKGRETAANKKIFKICLGGVTITEDDGEEEGSVE